MKDVFYINSKNQKIDFMQPPYYLETGDFFNFNWKYDSVSSLTIGGEITDFTKEIQEFSLNLAIINYGRRPFEYYLNMLSEVTEYDVVNKTPGKLYIGEQYLSCYIIASEKKEWEADCSFISCEQTVCTEYPLWIAEKKYQCLADNNETPEETKFLDYPFDYNYDYAGKVKGNEIVVNNHYTSCNFMAYIYGPVTNPNFWVGNHLYEVETTLDSKEYMVIDSVKKTIRRVRTNGLIVNEFNNRNKKSSIFEKIPEGNNVLSWTGNFGIDLILFQERSEPKW